MKSVLIHLINSLIDTGWFSEKTQLRMIATMCYLEHGRVLTPEQGNWILHNEEVKEK